jgi:hypothetical protein
MIGRTIIDALKTSTLTYRHPVSQSSLALLSQRNVEEAARVAKVAPRTIYRWMKDPDFADEPQTVL